jgi:hypothetical protein
MTENHNLGLYKLELERFILEKRLVYYVQSFKTFKAHTRLFRAAYLSPSAPIIKRRPRGDATIISDP